MDISNIDQSPPQWARLAYRTLDRKLSGPQRERFLQYYAHGVAEGRLLPEEELFKARTVPVSAWLGLHEIGSRPDVYGARFGLLQAVECKIEAMGMLAATIMSAPDIRSYLQVLATYGPMLDPNSTMDAKEITGGALFSVFYPHISGLTGAQFCEAGLYMWEDGTQRMTGWHGDIKTAVTFGYETPMYNEDYIDVYFSEVSFDPELFSQKGTGWQIFVPDQLLDMPNPHYNDVVFKMSIEAMVALAKSRAKRKAERDGGNWSMLVSQTLTTAQKMPSLEQVAERNGINSRTLQKYLKAEGVSWQALLDEAIMNRARAMLQSSHSVADVAASIGMTEGNFRKKFTRIEGISPTKWANSQKVAA